MKPFKLPHAARIVSWVMTPAKKTGGLPPEGRPT